MMDEYERAVQAYNLGCDAVRALERSMGEAPEAWYERLALRYQQAAASERRRAGAQGQAALFGDATGRRYN